jgi:hypothetical protein
MGRNGERARLVDQLMRLQRAYRQGDTFPTREKPFGVSRLRRRLNSKEDLYPLSLTEHRAVKNGRRHFARGFSAAHSNQKSSWSAKRF